jgi:hypothetical protein
MFCAKRFLLRDGFEIVMHKYEVLKSKCNEQEPFQQPKGQGQT